jgi:hypothetical protein
VTDDLVEGCEDEFFPVFRIYRRHRRFADPREAALGAGVMFVVAIPCATGGAPVGRALRIDMTPIMAARAAHAERALPHR